MKSKINRIKLIVVTLFSVFAISHFGSTLSAREGVIPQPAHSRPYFMPDSRRQEILKLISEEPWAKQEFERIKKAVLEMHSLPGKSKIIEDDEEHNLCFWAAFLYALEGGEEYLDVAVSLLKQEYGDDAPETILAKKTLNDPDYWKGNEKAVPWYRLDFDGYVAYDWIYNGLNKEDRELLHNTLSMQTRFRMACMDSWTSNANLVFKPISMVAFAGMALREKDILEWGWKREVKQGSFYSMMDKMFKDGAVWGEAAIYAVTHSAFYCVTTMAFYRSIYEKTNWFDHETPSGSCVRKITDYYINTAYPLEHTGVGKGRIRVVTYGDGSTAPPRYGGRHHDMFIGGVYPNKHTLYTHMKKGLAMAYATSGNPHFAPFLSLYPDSDYKANLWDRPSLKDTLNWPKAPSTIWPEFGLAILRSDETPGYFNNPNAIAAFQLMTKSYGHQQPDKFHINFYGAGRLLYPDYYRTTYENRAIGWTYTSASHNTMLVDEKDTETAEPHIRSEFSPEVKFLATSASGLFTMVDQTRTLMLTKEYLLDLFQATSKIPRTYDYVLHSMGLPSPVTPAKFESEGNISNKYWALDAPQRTTTSEQWSLDFNLEEQPPNGEVLGLGKEWFDHIARCRVTMAADNNTQVCYGTWGDGLYMEKAVKAYAAANAPSPGHRRQAVASLTERADQVGMLIVRRPVTHGTVFAATHEPYSNDQKPQISSITKIAQTDDALVVRVRGKNFTDYAAIAWGKEGDNNIQLLKSNDGKEIFRFKNYAWLRIPDNGTPVARGGWQAFQIPGNTIDLVLNGQRKKLKHSEGQISFGKIPSSVPATEQLGEFPFELINNSVEPRLTVPGKETVLIKFKNILNKTVEGSLKFDPEAGISVEPASPTFGPLKPNESAEVQITLQAAEGAPTGKRILPVAAVYRIEGENFWINTLSERYSIIIGRSVTQDFSQEFMSQMYEGPELSARLESSGLLTYMADAKGTVRLNGSPLYIVRDQGGTKHLSEDQPVITGQWWGLRSTMGTHHNAGGGGFRMSLNFLNDRIGGIGLIEQSSRQDHYIFTLPGNWISPAGPPKWNKIIALDKDGKEFEAKPGTDAPIVAAELSFPDGGQSLAFSFSPPMPVQINELSMEFILKRPVDNISPQWSVGFCKPGSLDEWRIRD